MSNESLEQVLSRLLTRTTDEVYCSCPCQVLRVNFIGQFKFLTRIKNSINKIDKTKILLL